MKRSTSSHSWAVHFAGCGLLCAALALPDLVGATPLDKGTCAKLAQELQNMKALDVDKLMQNGPAWAADHLSSTQLGYVRHFIDVDEQMRFRCSAPKSLVHLKHFEDDDEDGGAKPADGASAKAMPARSKPSAAKAAKAPDKIKKAAEPASESLR